MQPIQELLSRIRWDAEFGSGTFEVAYDDHRQKSWVRVPLSADDIEGGSSFMFRTWSVAGERISVPLHRIHAVYRNGQLIWYRNRQAPSS